jgi:hypothetical protein
MMPKMKSRSSQGKNVVMPPRWSIFEHLHQKKLASHTESDLINVQGFRNNSIGLNRA